MAEPTPFILDILRRAGLDGRRDELAPLLAESIAISATPLRRKGAVSRLGGRPAMPDAMEWPQGINSRRQPGALPFLAQIALAELPDVKGRAELPASGQLYIFADLISDMIFDTPGRLRVVHWPDDGAPLDERPHPADMIAADPEYMMSDVTSPAGFEAVSPVRWCGFLRWVSLADRSDMPPGITMTYEDHVEIQARIERACLEAGFEREPFVGDDFETFDLTQAQANDLETDDLIRALNLLTASRRRNMHAPPLTADSLKRKDQGQEQARKIIPIDAAIVYKFAFVNSSNRIFGWPDAVQNSVFGDAARIYHQGNHLGGPAISGEPGVDMRGSREQQSVFQARIDALAPRMRLLLQLSPDDGNYQTAEVGNEAPPLRQAPHSRQLTPETGYFAQGGTLYVTIPADALARRDFDKAVCVYQGS